MAEEGSQKPRRDSLQNLGTTPAAGQPAGTRDIRPATSQN